jgi:hypothetical protein
VHHLVEFLLARIAEDRAALGLFDRQFHESDRWVAECEARRAIVELVASGVEGIDGVEGCDRLEGCDVLLLLAQPYVDHPDFCEAWRR